MKKIIKIAKQLIDLPYNKFNLSNYHLSLNKNFDNMKFVPTDKNSPIQLMSNYHNNSGIITCNYNNDFYKKRRIFIIGKGILFDSGGLDLKKGMVDMTTDKAGMVISIAVANYLKQNVIAYCPVTTNFIHSSLITPGDQIKIGNKTVRIENTDAEGRLILAEALSKLKVSKNDFVITIATLTGCCEYAVDKSVGVLTPSNKFANKFLRSAAKEKEYAWRLPMFDYMQKEFNKKLISNISKKKAGTSMAAMFLKQFVKYPNNWLHLDIASGAFDKNQKANGVPIKTLINFIKGVK